MSVALLNTVPLVSRLVAHGQDYLAVYVDGTVYTYLKDSANNTLVLQPTTYVVADVRAIRMSQNGRVIAVQTKTKTIRLQNGAQTPFDSIGSFDVANTGHIIIVNAVSSFIHIIAQTTVNLSAAVTDDDRVVCGTTGYMVYNTARTLTAPSFAAISLTTTPYAKEIVFATHGKDNKYAIFYKDKTATYNGITRTVVGPFAGFRGVGAHFLTTDYKQTYYQQRFAPLSDAKQLRAFNWQTPVAAKVDDWAALRLLAVGDSFSNAGFDSKNSIGVANSGAMVVANDSPFGTAGKSLEFNGTSSYLQTVDSADIQLGAADFTIELFVKVATGATGAITVVSKGGGLNISWASFLLQAIASTQSFCFSASFTNTKLDVGTSDGVGSWGSFEFDVWTHIAISRKGSNWRCFQDGMLKAKYVASGSIYANATRGLTVGHSRQSNFNTGLLYGLLKGRIHALAIHNYAKYTHNFVADTIPLVQEV